MGNLGWTEMFFIAAFALVIFGPRKLPEIARTIARFMRQIRQISDQFKETWEAELEKEGLKDVDKELRQELSSLGVNNLEVEDTDDSSDEITPTSSEIASEPNHNPPPVHNDNLMPYTAPINTVAKSSSAPSVEVATATQPATPPTRAAAPEHVADDHKNISNI